MNVLILIPREIFKRWDDFKAAVNLVKESEVARGKDVPVGMQSFIPGFVYDVSEETAQQMIQCDLAIPWY